LPGWARLIGAFDEVFGSGGTLGWETAGGVVLLGPLVPALKKLDSEGPPEAMRCRRQLMFRNSAGSLLVCRARLQTSRRACRPAGEAMPEVAGLAHVQDCVASSVHSIDTRPLRQLLEEDLAQTINDRLRVSPETQLSGVHDRAFVTGA
jgi:hypothetical protein